MAQDKFLDPNLRRQFTGTEHWYRHGLVRSILFTDGAKYVADQGRAYWLLDEIALARRFEIAVAAEAFQVWTSQSRPHEPLTRIFRIRYSLSVNTSPSLPSAQRPGRDP